MLTLIDFFCGAGGSSQGAHAVPGVEVKAAANHWLRALESHEANFPATSHYQGDIRDMDMSVLPRGDIFWASPECFPAGTLILARRGLVPVEDIAEGDEVFTHQRRWRPVMATMSRAADTVIVKGVGMAAGLETTAEHPVYARERVREWDNATRRYRDHLGPAAAWTSAAGMAGKLWATPVDFGEELPVPPMPGRELAADSDFWWMVGRWLGDGNLRIKHRGSLLPPMQRRLSQPIGSGCIVCGEPARPRKGKNGLESPYCSDRCKRSRARRNPDHGRYDITIVCGFTESEELAERLRRVAGLRWARRELRTASAFTASHRGLVEWIAEQFGRGAGGKTVPAWALTMPRDAREALLDGYLSADGYIAHATQMNTVSKRLALGLRMLADSLGHRANMYGPYERKKEARIEGRVIKERPQWTVSWITGGGILRHFVAEAEGLRWLPVKEVGAGRRATVYNITVAEDESYIADGIVVHNCPQWSQARGKQRDFDRQPDLFGETLPDEAAERSRALMWDVPRYLEAMSLRGKPVLAGVVENVTDVRQWDHWRQWTAAIEALGYRTRLIAINSMHARPRVTLLAPQSRDRLYLAYWLRSVGRDPDWDKWLRPQAWCPSCGEVITAVQLFKRAGNDMGRYRQQYQYHCARFSCRGQVVEPGALPAAAAIDWDHPGQRIGDRERPLSPKTLARIRAGFERYARPITVQAAGNTFERRPGVRTWPVDAPLTTQTTSDTKGVAVPPVLVPAGGTWRQEGAPVTDPMGARTTRENDGVAVPPFITVHRGGPDEVRTSDVGDPLQTLAASGNHFGLVAPPFISMLRGPQNAPKGIDEPMPTLMTGNNHYLTAPPFITVLRNNSKPTAIDDPLGTVTTMGAHHYLTVPNGSGPTQPDGWVPLALLMRNNSGGAEMSTPVTEPARTMTTKGHQSLVTWADILVPYYGTGVAHDVAEPVGTLSTRDRFALVSGAFSIEDALFRMLEPREIGRAMAFAGSYIVLGNKREKTRMYGNAVTPPVAEVIVSALVECITGEDLPLGADLGRDAA